MSCLSCIAVDFVKCTLSWHRVDELPFEVLLWPCSIPCISFLGSWMATTRVKHGKKMFIYIFLLSEQNLDNNHHVIITSMGTIKAAMQKGA